MSEDGGILLRPPEAFALLVLAHGAGAGMRHSFMEGVAQSFHAAGVATWRWELPYMASGRRRPDPPRIAVPAVREAVARGSSRAPDLPLFAGGKSFGGRMTSTAASQGPLFPADGGDDSDGVVGVIFLGFPLHPARKPGTQRAEHLESVSLPMLFLQGDRDRLAELDLMRPVVRNLGAAATLHVVAGADHGFRVLKRSGRTEQDVLDELARVGADWMRARLAG